MSLISPAYFAEKQTPPDAPCAANHRVMKVAAFSAAAVSLLFLGTPATALAAGVLFTMFIGNPFGKGSSRITKWLLQACVVLLGFSMDLPSVIRMGANGSLFAAATIGSTLLIGVWLGRKMSLNRRTSFLLSAGTAICGGSAIAAVSSVISATEAEIAVSIGTIFVLNALALYVFPLLGHLLHLSQFQFGLWAGVAIHDISSVVGAGLSFGPVALQTATAVKLSRSLWIVPLTLAIASISTFQESPNSSAPSRRRNIGNSIPWFIGLFLLASLLRSYVPAISVCGPWLLETARRGMILVLFLIGTSLSILALRKVGWRTAATGMALWTFVSAVSLVSILSFS
jgi:uncharacterized integral membrane protein (TIGR00698 family)